jgi:hypothetical protein
MPTDTLAGVLIAKCFNARTDAHVLHLQTRNYAEHVALAEFYEAIVGLADSFAESYQGQYGVIESFPLKHERDVSAPNLLEGLATWIGANRDDICDDTHLHNIIDEIVALTYRTLYKINTLS